MSLITFVLFLEYFHFQHLEIARLWRGGYYLETITHSFILGLGFILGGTSGTTYPSIEFVIKKIIIKTVFADKRITGGYSLKILKIFSICQKKRPKPKLPKNGYCCLLNVNENYHNTILQIIHPWNHLSWAELKPYLEISVGYCIIDWPSFRIDYIFIKPASSYLHWLCSLNSDLRLF